MSKRSRVTSLLSYSCLSSSWVERFIVVFKSLRHSSTSLSSTSYLYLVDICISCNLHLRDCLFRNPHQAFWDWLGEPYDPALCWDDYLVCLTCSLCPSWRCQTHLWQMCKALQVKKLCSLVHHISWIWSALSICPHGNLIYPEGCAETTFFGELHLKVFAAPSGSDHHPISWYLSGNVSPPELFRSLEYFSSFQPECLAQQ